MPNTKIIVQLFDPNQPLDEEMPVLSPQSSEHKMVPHVTVSPEAVQQDAPTQESPPSLEGTASNSPSATMSSAVLDSMRLYVQTVLQAQTLAEVTAQTLARTQALFQVQPPVLPHGLTPDAGAAAQHAAPAHPQMLHYPTPVNRMTSAFSTYQPNNFHAQPSPPIPEILMMLQENQKLKQQNWILSQELEFFKSLYCSMRQSFFPQ
ncbi:unnamed protein product [Caenorhabditis sp. 36 PRJEB53466]|nr:unnamed protein product [Caenorhabditis sp. 36 PRJEB53466]